MANLFETAQLTITDAPRDLHYQLTEPSTGAVVAQVSPVAVGTPRQENGLRRFFRVAKRGRRVFPAESHHVPRITFRVADTRDATLFSVDRADKLIGSPATPHSAVVDANGGVLG